MLKISPRTLFSSILIFILYVLFFKVKNRENLQMKQNLQKNKILDDGKYYDTPLAKPPEGSSSGWIGAFGLITEVPKSEWRYIIISKRILCVNINNLIISEDNA